MFALHSIELNNFRSYRGEHKFKFPTKVGLYFMSGENRTDDIGGNGAGKSTLWEAVTWIMYGRTSRGLKANEVISWGASTCQGVLDLTVGDNRYFIKRSQKPNNLTIDGKPVDQEELEKHIRLNFDAFLYSVLNAQFGRSFFAMKPSDKLTLFSDIMRLDYWLQLSDRAAAAAKDLEIDIRGHQQAIEQHEAKMEVAKADITILELKESTFKAERQKQIDEIKAESVKAWKDVRKYADVLEHADEDEKKLTTALKAASKEVARHKGNIDYILQEISNNSADKKRAVTDHEYWVSALKRLPQVGATCRECGRPMDAKHLQAETNRMTKLRDVKAADIKELNMVHEQYLGDVVRQKGFMARDEADVERLHNHITEHRRKVAQAEAKANAAQTRFDELGTRLHEVERAPNPHTEMLERKRTQVKAYKKIIAESTETVNQLEAEHVAVSYWIKGFKRVRLFIIEQAFNALEIEVNNSLAQLGMTNWQITFDIERENKTGGTTKGFVVFVKGPSNTEPVRWENWSGGETQRLQLAGDLGLANLIMQQQGLANTIEVFDEPSTHLSVEGMADLANLLHERALSDGKCIWIVDHTSITNFGDFEQVIKVRKDKHGSRII